MRGVMAFCVGDLGRNEKDGARKPRGALGEMSGEICSLRDLKPDVP